MAGTVIDRVWRETTADAIEADLAALWREVGRRQPVARAIMSNLVVFRNCESAADVQRSVEASDLPLDDIVARHPSRVIVVARTSPVTSPLDAIIGILTYGPPAARYGVEHIGVRSSCADEPLPSLVRRLVRGGVPTSIWCVDDLSSRQLPDSLVTIARQLIFDSRRWTNLAAGIQALSSALANPRLEIVDINWRRLAPIRQAFLHAGDELDLDELRHANVRIAHRPGERALAYLLAGWLASRVGWPSAVRPPVDESLPNGNEVLTVEVGRNAQPTVIALSNRQLTVKQRGWPAYTTVVRLESDADAIAAELKSLTENGCLREALRAVARLTGSGSS